MGEGSATYDLTHLDGMCRGMAWQEDVEEQKKINSEVLLVSRVEDQDERRKAPNRKREVVVVNCAGLGVQGE